MTQFYCKCTNVDRAGFSKCRAQLEVLIRGPTEWYVKKFFWGCQAIMIEVIDVKKLGLKRCRRDMNDIPFHHLAVLLRTNNKTVLSLSFLAKILS